MEHVYHLKLGDSRRLALPAELCRSLDLKPGEELLVIPNDEGLTITPLRRHAELMRQELRGMVNTGKPLTEELKQLRKAEAAREADPR